VSSQAVGADAAGGSNVFAITDSRNGYNKSKIGYQINKKVIQFPPLILRPLSIARETALSLQPNNWFQLSEAAF
jgi:hypothetical protein